MRKFIIRLLLLSILGVIIYSILFSTIKFDNDFFAIEKIKTGNVQSLVYKKYKGFNFIWQRSCPWWYKTYRIPKEHLLNTKLYIQLPQVKTLKKTEYYITIPISITYIIQPERLFNKNAVKDNNKLITEYFKKQFTALYAKEFEKYVEPLYNRPGLLKKMKSIHESVLSKTSDTSASLGLRIKNHEILGNVYTPTESLIRSGLAYIEELRKLDKENNKEIKLLKKKLALERLMKKRYYDELREISKIIQKNPLILKYIYIDKIASKSNLVISPDFFTVKKKSSKGIVKKGDVDNLK